MTEQVIELKRQIRIMQDSLERKNKLLEAYWHVWCSGGCGGIGSGAYFDEETLLVAEGAVKRMRTYYDTQEYHIKNNGDPYGIAKRRGLT